MRRIARKLGAFALFCAVLATAQNDAIAETPASPAAADAGNLQPWEGFVDQLQAIGPRMMAKLPPRLRGDPLVQQQATRLLLAATARMSIQTIIGDRDHPIFLPALNVALNIAQPNADTTYRYAIVAPGGTYRLTGTRGTVRVVAISQSAPTVMETGKARPRLADHDLDTAHIDAQGHFDILLSPAQPAGYSGDWWQLDPETTSLSIRQVGYDWSQERDPTIAIERMDKPAARGPDRAEQMQQWLDELPGLIANTAIYFVDHVEQLRQEGYINKFKVFDALSIGGLSGQFYYEAAFDLKDDEALVIEARVPAQCRYWSVLLTNDVYETIDWYNNHSSINGSQAVVDKDGVFRAVVSGRDPGVRNWLDTGGRRGGAVQGRWLQCADTPVPSVRKVALADVRKSLPADTAMVTAAQRETIIRERRMALQQRPLW